jgi:hypothetical protein
MLLIASDGELRQLPLPLPETFYFFFELSHIQSSITMLKFKSGSVKIMSRPLVVDVMAAG